MHKIDYININLNLNLSNKEDIIRLQSLIDYSLNLNVGSVQVIKREINIFVNEDN